MRLALVTHANNGRRLGIDFDLVSAWWTSEDGSTHIMFNGGGIIPTKESFETITDLKKTTAPNEGAGGKKKDG